MILIKIKVVRYFFIVDGVSKVKRANKKHKIIDLVPVKNTQTGMNNNNAFLHVTLISCSLYRKKINNTMNKYEHIIPKPVGDAKTDCARLKPNRSSILLLKKVKESALPSHQLIKGLEEIISSTKQYNVATIIKAEAYFKTD